MQIRRQMRELKIPMQLQPQNLHNQTGGILEKKSIKLIFASSLENLSLIAGAAKGLCETIVEDKWLLYQLELCVVEVVTNIVVHGYQRKDSEIIELEIHLEPHRITFKFYDTGIKNAPQLNIDFEINPHDLAAIPESGRGLSLIHSFMDSVQTGEEKGKNLTLLIKHLG